MTQQLQQAITLAQSLSIGDQLELLKTLSELIQQSYTSLTQATAESLGFEPRTRPLPCPPKTSPARLQQSPI